MTKLIDCIEAVAFDLDGTLIDTAPDLGAAANMMLVILGGTPLPQHRFAALIGGGIYQFVASVLAESRGIAVPDRALCATAAALFRDLYGQRLFERSRIYPGVIQTLCALERAAITTGCITNKESRFAQPLIEAADLRDLLALTLCADRAEDRKPSPNLLLAACARMGVEPAQMLYVGDSRVDIIAARAAGCRVVAVNYGYHHHHLPLAHERPDGIVSNLMEIIALSLHPHGGTSALRAVS